MAETTLDAAKVWEGQAVTKIVRARFGIVDKHIYQTEGRWPTVTNARHLPHGTVDGPRRGYPTVYLEPSDVPGWRFCLNPADQVTVLKVIS
jgi:hypothetical protein